MTIPKYVSEGYVGNLPRLNTSFYGRTVSSGWAATKAKWLSKGNNPTGSMYGISTYIYHSCREMMVNKPCMDPMAIKVTKH